MSINLSPTDNCAINLWSVDSAKNAISSPRVIAVEMWMFFALKYCSICVSVRICFYGTQVKERGGNCVPVICDSTNDKDIEELFERIKHEQNGRLDILVNNAYAGVQVQYTALSWNSTWHIAFLKQYKYLWINYYSRQSSRVRGKSSGKLIRPCGILSTTQASGTFFCAWSCLLSQVSHFQ